MKSLCNRHSLSMKRSSLSILLLLAVVLPSFAFQDPKYPNLEFTVLDEEAKTVSVKAVKKSIYKAEDTLSIPSSVLDDQFTVTEVDTLGFNGIAIAHISIPSTIQRIDSGAFRDISSSFTIEFNEGLIEVGDRAFCASTGLKGTVVLPSTLKTICSSAAFLNTSIDGLIIKPTTPPVFTKNEHKSYPLPSVPMQIPCNTWKQYANVWGVYKGNLVDPCFATTIVDGILYTPKGGGAMVIDYVSIPTDGILTFPEEVVIGG